MTDPLVTDSLTRVLAEIEYPEGFFESYYEEPHRHYHGMNHMVALLGAAKDAAEYFGLTPDQVQLLHLMIWFHDIHYTPEGMSDGFNESASTMLFIASHNMGGENQLTDEAVEIVSNAIRDTITHDSPSSWLSAIFLDLDMSPLALPWHLYEANSNLIWLEVKDYATREQFIEGRCNFIVKTLGTPVIFHTAWGFSKEEPARQNLKREFLKLKEEEK